MRPVAGLDFTGSLGKTQISYSRLGLGRFWSATGGICKSGLALERDDFQLLFGRRRFNKAHDLRSNSFLNSTVFIRI